MIFHSLAEKTFTEGLKMYLNETLRNPLGVTKMEHLYDNWQHAVEGVRKDNDSNYKIADLFDSWEHQEGYPILFVERSYNDHRVRFTQVS
jgi:aminopeptidase N